MLHTAFPRCHIAAIEQLTDGLRNANFKLQLDSLPEPIVLRIYEHDASLCQKEVDLIRLAGRSAPAPEVIHAEPRGFDDVPRSLSCATWKALASVSWYAAATGMRLRRRHSPRVKRWPRLGAPASRGPDR
jgi:hypothetical protein